MSLISIESQKQIAEAIEQAEKKTSGEIVTVVASASSSYRFIALLWAAMIALALPLPLIYLQKIYGNSWDLWSVENIYLMQLSVFVILACIVQWKPLRHAIVPKSVKHDRAHSNAVKQFLAQNLHTTNSRTGVLIFVSVAEQYAEIIADEGIYEKVSRTVWSQIVQSLISNIRNGQPAVGFIEAINKCGLLMAEHFPPGSEDPNELPDHLIILQQK